MALAGLSYAAYEAGDLAQAGLLFRKSLTFFPANPGDVVSVDWAAKPEGTCAKGCAPIVSVGTTENPASLNWQTVSAAPGPNGWLHYHYQSTVPLPI